MTDPVTHAPLRVTPDATRKVIRPFALEDSERFSVKDKSRAQRIVDRIMTLDAPALARELAIASKPLQDRYRDLDAIFMERFQTLEGLSIDRAALNRQQALVIGAYFSEEFAFESAALFNPSIVLHPDQSGVEAGGLRFLLSLRGIGEGHISSVIFRSGVWSADGGITVDAPSDFAMGPTVKRSEGDAGQLIVHLHTDGAREISETVIYPFMPSQGRGIEDVRLVAFTEDDGAKDFRGTFTAFNGTDVRQGMLRTSDFRTFEMRGVQGKMYDGKGMALFPRRIDGRYFMLGRQDNENIWILSSDDLYTWNDGEKIVSPMAPWEFIQMGNCGSPIEIDEGWLVLTHGVGPMRNYCMGACLLDKADPSKVIARLAEPLLEPEDHMRDGYVPNVVYSCGALLRGRQLLLPYGVADSFTSFVTVDVNSLLHTMR